MPRYAGLQDLVFVYGTLRRGCRNHRLLRGARFLGHHCTEARFRMLDVGAYPGVVSPGSTPIAGEVYRVPPRILSALDQLEDYPRSYTRERIETPWGRAWIYLYRQTVGSLREIPGGDWVRRRRFGVAGGS